MPEVKLDNLTTLANMFDYLCSKVDWSKSFLDADAIACMNRLFIELRKDTRRMTLSGEPEVLNG